MNRFFSSERAGDVFILRQQDDVQHIRKVLRLREGDFIEICDHVKEYRCRITRIEEAVEAEIEEALTVRRESPLTVTLFQGLPKLDKMEWIIQKTTELGVDRIVPVQTHRAIMKLKKENKVQRWQKVAQAAAMQSKRLIIPTVDSGIAVDKLLGHYGDQLDILLVPYENQEAGNLKAVLEAHRGAGRVGIFIGPEGGLDEKDLEAVESDKTFRISLGNRILRTETAAILAVGLIQYAWGDLGE